MDDQKIVVEKSPIVKFGFLEITPRISLADIVAFVGLISIGFATFYGLQKEDIEIRHETRTNLQRIEAHRERIVALETRQEALRNEIRGELREMNHKLDEIQRYLRDLNRKPQ